MLLPQAKVSNSLREKQSADAQPCSLAHSEIYRKHSQDHSQNPHHRTLACYVAMLYGRGGGELKMTAEAAVCSTGDDCPRVRGGIPRIRSRLNGKIEDFCA
eukprot:1346873-Amorphochlora_amoeboformis.AAC.1